MQKNNQKGRKKRVFDKRLTKVGLKVMYVRKERGLTQAELAEIAGCSPGYLSQIETPRNNTECSLSMLLRIADALEVDITEFLADK